MLYGPTDPEYWEVEEVLLKGQGALIGSCISNELTSTINFFNENRKKHFELQAEKEQFKKKGLELIYRSKPFYNKATKRDVYLYITRIDMR